MSRLVLSSAPVPLAVLPVEPVKRLVFGRRMSTPLTRRMIVNQTTPPQACVASARDGEVGIPSWAWIS